MHTRICAREHPHTCTQIYFDARVRILCMCMYTDAFMHACIHMRTHARVHSRYPYHAQRERENSPDMCPDLCVLKYWSVTQRNKDAGVSHKAQRCLSVTQRCWSVTQRCLSAP
eukprot:Tamp_40018.p2 GENE.Tamp_40018~~Tamp_40018.p2  ORF type:complete len:113 (-),score=7.43 Tamp_40018:55-393(-)